MKTTISIGNFDAVHIGHVALVQAARDAVGANGRVEIWSFDPPPAVVLKPDLHLDRITTFEQRKVLLIDAGADEVKKLEPTEELLSQSPEAFISSVIAETIPAFFVEGSEFRFGKNRTGSNDTLRALGQRFNFSCIELDGVDVTLGDDSTVRASSSMVRSLINAGRVEDAQVMLGRPVQVHGVVEKGDQRGQSMGIPTANLGYVETMLPNDGIYAGSTTIDGESYNAAISIGTKPTFGINDRVCEAHIIGFKGELNHYGWQLTVNITHRVRNQLRFDSQESLKEAMLQDIETVKNTR